MAINYASRDYPTIRNDLLIRAREVLPEWTDRDPSDFGMLMVDLWAYMGDVIHYYLDRAVQEKFTRTATQRESLVALANLFDYEPSSRTSAEGTITLSNSGDIDQVIAPYTQFIARNDNKTYILHTRSSYIIPAGGSLAIVAYEGSVVQDEVLSSNSSGSTFQRYSLANTDVVKDSIVVTVFEDNNRPVSYSQVIRLGDYGPDRRVFKTNTVADNTVEIVFGNNVSGYAPPINSRVVATYSYSTGALGNLPSNRVVGFRTTTPSGITITSSSSFSGGANEESIESLRTSVSSYISSQNRAVTKSDFIAFAKQVNGVAKVGVSYTPNPAGGASAGNASVTIYAHPSISDAEYVSSISSSASVSPALQEAVVNYVQPKSIMGIDVVCASSIDWVKVNLAVNVIVSSSYIRYQVNNAVQQALESVFYFSNVSYGQRMTIGHIYRTILNVEGVDYCTISVFDYDSSSPQSVQDFLEVDEFELLKLNTLTINSTGGVTSA